MDGYGLTALLFAREVSTPLTSMVRTIDGQLETTARRQSKRGDNFGVFIIVLSDDPAMKQKLKDLAAREKLKHVVLCTHPVEGPRRYKVAREADLTVVVYNANEQVTANFPLAKGELNEKKSGAILEAITRVLPKK